MSLILFEFFEDAGEVSIAVPGAIRSMRPGTPKRWTLAVPPALRGLLPPAVTMMSLIAPRMVRLVRARPRRVAEVMEARRRRVVAEEE